jgi:hypothetical protein
MTWKSIKIFFVLLGLHASTHADINSKIGMIKDTRTLGFELLINYKDKKTNDKKFLELFPELFFSILHKIENEDPSIVLGKIFTLMQKTIPAEQEEQSCNLILDTHLHLNKPTGIYFSFLFEAGTDINEYNRWKMMIASIENHITEYEQTKNVPLLLEKLGSSIAAAYKIYSNTPEINENNEGNRFKFDLTE